MHIRLNVAAIIKRSNALHYQRTTKMLSLGP